MDDITKGLDLRSNSEASKQEHKMARVEKGGETAVPPERRNIKKPVLSEGSKASKAGLVNKICNVFFRGRNFEDVGSYVLKDVLIPTIIDGVANAGKAAIDGICYGESKPGSASKYGNQKTNYSTSGYGSMTRSSGNAGGVVASGGRGSRQNDISRSRRGFEPIKLSSRRDAENVLKYLQDIVDQYDNVSVSEYYEAFDNESISALARYTDLNYGWFDLSDVEILHIPGGWVIDLPDPVRLK